MTLRKKITIGTRGSPLALKQTDIVANALKSASPSLDIEVRVIETKGDVDQNPIPLDVIGKGLFTKEIEHLLQDQKIDLAIHSLKDMADEMPTGLYIGAYSPREDARDVLITKQGQSLETLPPGAVIGTDSLRRQVQMHALRPDIEMKSIRGNILTRLNKLKSESYDAIILAAAGLKRLGVENQIVRYFEPDEITPAPGQGILAVQARRDNSDLHKMLQSINDPDAARMAQIERSFAHKAGGGCKNAVGAYAFRDGNMCHLIGMIALEHSSQIIRDRISAPLTKSDGLGESLAIQLLKQLDKHA